MTVASFSPLMLDQFDSLLSTPEAVQQLNQTILQLAVQGRLVEQNPNEEPISETLERTLLKSPKVINEVEQPLNLPKTWEWVYLSSLCNKVQDGTHFSPKIQYETRQADTYLYITSKNIKADGVNLSNVTYIDSVLHHKVYQRCNPEKGDVLLVKDGAMTGMVTINNIEEEFTLLSSVALIKPNKQVLLPEYLKIYLRSPVGFDSITGKMSGSAIRRIVMNRLNKTLVAVPPLAEQKRIVARVEELLAQTRQLADKLTRNEQELTLLNQSALAHLLASQTPEEFETHWNFIAEHFDSLFTEPEHVAPLRQSILELAVRGKLTRREAGDESAKELLKRIKAQQEKNGKVELLPKVKEDEKPFELPEKWEWIRLKELGQTQTGTTPPTSNLEFFGQDYPFIKPADITENATNYSNEGLSKLGIEKGRRIKANSILMVCIGGSIGKVGYVDRDCSCNQQINALTPSAELSDKAIFYFLKSPYFRNEVLSRAPKTTLPILSKGKWEVIPLPLPPVAEQERIVAKVEQLLSLCDALESRLWEGREARGRLVESVLAGVGNND